MQLSTSMSIRHLPKQLGEEGITDIDTVAEYLHRLKVMQNEENLWSYDRYTESGNASSAFVFNEYTQTKRSCILWCLNNYLGLNRHPEVIRHAQETVAKFGTGSGTPAMSGGMSSLHKEVQSTVASLLGKEKALMFSTGYTTNLGALSSLPGKKTLLLMDHESHASMFDGCRLSGKDWLAFRHNDMNNLEDKLKRNRDKYENIIVAVESAYSMSGDLCPIKDVVSLKKKYGFHIYVDEAHSFGFYGESGRGYCHEQGVSGDIDFLMATLSKAIPGIGGFIATQEKFCTFLQTQANPYIFQTCIPPTDAAVILASLKLIRENPGMAASLHEKNAYFRAKLRDLGFNLRNSKSPVIPIYISNLDTLFKCSRELYENGFFSVAVAYPAVKLSEGRLRFTLTSAHTYEQIDQTVSALADLDKKFGIASRTAEVDK
jgi:8-amino-7-oxononanoate synthase